MIVFNICFIFRLHGVTADLASDALGRLKLRFSLATLCAYTRMFRNFLAFLMSAGLHLSQVNTVIVFGFMEYLYIISNYMAGIRAMYKVNGLDTKPFRNDRLPFFV